MARSTRPNRSRLRRNRRHHSARCTRARVLKSFKNLHRARYRYFGDLPDYFANSRMLINDTYRANKHETDPVKLQAQIEEAEVTFDFLGKMVRVDVDMDTGKGEMKFNDPSQTAWGETYQNFDDMREPCRCFGGQEVCSNCCREKA